MDLQQDIRLMSTTVERLRQILTEAEIAIPAKVTAKPELQQWLNVRFT